MRTELALAFLKAARAGDKPAAEPMLTPNARHHNPYFAAGMPALLDAIAAASTAAPNTTFDAKRTVENGDIVVVHSHVRHQPNEPGFAVIHMFRFENDLIAEMWDIGQAIPANNPNSDGMF